MALPLSYTRSKQSFFRSLLTLLLRTHYRLQPPRTQSLFMRWGVQDSNLRRHCHQIYSLTPLTARETPRRPLPDVLAILSSNG